MAAKTLEKKKVEYKLPTRNIWFPNQVEPDVDDENFIEYWRNEKSRCLNGFYLADGQVFISGWLYWHTVYWVIELDEEITMPDGKKRSKKTKGTPILRDIEWVTHINFERALEEQKIYEMVGSRGWGKSMICGSVVGHAFTFYSDSESLTTGGNGPDIAKLNEKVNLGLSNLHPAFTKQRVLDNWKVEVKAGWKDKTSGLIRGSNSRIIIRNYEDGNNTMAANGTRPKVHIIDEIGKLFNLINCVLDSKPCWMNDYGMFSLVILAGTGGDMEVGQDAGRIFNNPEAYGVLEFEDEWEGTGKIGFFLPATKARNEYKEPWTLAKYLGIEHPDLERITIMVSNEEKCLEEFVKPRRKAAMKATSSNEIIKEKAYYPIVPSECFLTISQNDFPVEAIKKHKDWLDKNGMKAMCVDLFKDTDGTIQHNYSNKLPVRDFPVKKETDKTGVIEIIEFPVANAPFGLYVAGIDPYKVSESDWSDSLGSVYIFKRMTSNMTETFQYMPVAWYAGRPKSIHTWYENVKYLLKFYNCIAMCENADYGFIQYMIAENEQFHIAQGQSYLKEISSGSKHKSLYGLPPTPAMIEHWNNNSVIYTKEEILKTRDDNGEVKETFLGATRIMDPMLLDEMMKFNKKVGNFDRVRSFGIALSYAKQLDALIAKVQIEETQMGTKITNTIKSPFMYANKSKGISYIKSPFLKSY